MATHVVDVKASELVDDGEVGGRMTKQEKFELKGGRSFPSKNEHNASLKRATLKDEFPKRLPVDEEKLKKHMTGADSFDPSKMRSRIAVKKAERLKTKFQERAEIIARAEILNKEEEGGIECDDNEFTYTIDQREIVANVDVASAEKMFDLHLPQYGPYSVDYTDNGRYLLIGGRRGHVAQMDWQTKKLITENNVMEMVRDVKFLHTETMYAVAQKHYTYIYDNRGVELHCVKSMHEANKLDFLHRHFLLVSASRTGYLNYLDVSVGKMVTEIPTKMGPLDVMCKNPANAIIHTGHSVGKVCLWAPSVQKPLVQMQCHKSAVRGIDIDSTGTYMYTTGLDLMCRVWDLRMHKQLFSYKMPSQLGHVAVSDKRVVACAAGNTVHVYRDMHLGHCREPYLVHRCTGVVKDFKFVPYEDVLGIGHSNGFSSILVPGAGESNVDMLRRNPYETKKQRKEREVKQLLDKIQPEMICLDPNEITRVNTDALEEEIEARKKLVWMSNPPIEFTARKRKGKRFQMQHIREGQVKERLRADRREEKRKAMDEFIPQDQREVVGASHVLDRFSGGKRFRKQKTDAEE